MTSLIALNLIMPGDFKLLCSSSKWLSDSKKDTKNTKIFNNNLHKILMAFLKLRTTGRKWNSHSVNEFRNITIVIQIYYPLRHTEENFSANSKFQVDWKLSLQTFKLYRGKKPYMYIYIIFLLNDF